MNRLFYFFLLLPALFSAQENIGATYVNDIPLTADILSNADDFGTLTYTLGNTLYRLKDHNKLSYSNIQLGPITQADAFNPLKLNLFYKNFNTVVVLDNRLSEIFKIDFNSLQPYRNVTHIATGYDTTIWIYNQNLQQLELFDYKTNKTRVSTLPVSSEVLDLKSNYNDVWLLTKNHLYSYNYFGSQVLKIKNENFQSISEDNGNLVIKTAHGLLFLAKNTSVPVPISIPNLLINQFLLTNESLYIYAGGRLHQFQLKIN